MDDDKVSTLTDRGQISIPASLRHAMKLQPGQIFLWERISDYELRLIAQSRPETRPGPRAMGGHANRYSGFPERTSAEWLAELRAGEEDE